MGKRKSKTPKGGRNESDAWAITKDMQLAAWMLPEKTLAKLRAYSAVYQLPQHTIVAEALETYLKRHIRISDRKNAVEAMLED